MSGSASATFTFSSNTSGASFECQLDSGSFVACSSPQTYAGLSEGSHTFRVRATSAGLTDPTPASATWTVDTDPPDTTIDSGPSGLVSTTSATFSFSSSHAGSTFECKLDAGSFQACSSPQSYSGLGDGQHTFTVRAIDPASNPDPTPATRTWTVDTTSPGTSITAAPPDPANSADASFEFSSPDTGATFECKLDGAGFTGCTSPKSYTALSDGDAHFRGQSSRLGGKPRPLARDAHVDDRHHCHPTPRSTPAPRAPPPPPAPASSSPPPRPTPRASSASSTPAPSPPAPRPRTTRASPTASTPSRCARSITAATPTPARRSRRWAITEQVSQSVPAGGTASSGS